MLGGRDFSNQISLEIPPFLDAFLPRLQRLFF